MAAKTGCEPQGELLASISNMVVSVYADHLGRGPTKARTFITEGVITCVLEDTLTRSERKLIESGKQTPVLELRATLQETMRTELAARAEELSGQQVRAIIAGTELEPDISTQIFVLGDSSEIKVKRPSDN
jgi:uncharacterized protein YbcI